MSFDFTKVFEKLLPKSGFWSLIFDRTFKKFFTGLSILPETIKAHADSMWLEAFPEHTTKNFDWSLQHGSPETLDQEGLEGEWGTQGSQTPQYLQDVIHAAGIETCYVHEFWEPGSDPLNYRNPIPFVEHSRVLTNGVFWVGKEWLWQTGGYYPDETPFQSIGDASIRTGDFSGYGLRYKQYPCLDIEAEYCHYFYICGAVYPTLAIVPKSKMRQLIRLIFKIKPLHLRCVLMVQVYDDTGGEEDDFDIQDTWWDQEEYQDTIDGEDIIQDH